MKWLKNAIASARGQRVTSPGVDRETMVAALKAHCVPALREAGFKGSFPNFYRDESGFIALVNFQFFSSGGSFCVNRGCAEPDRTNVYHPPDKEKSPAKLRVSATRDRRRLGDEGGDRGFCFGPTNYGQFRGTPRPAEEIAVACNTLFREDAEPWWATKKAMSQID